jgi:methionine biosynthesis protein MetW
MDLASQVKAMARGVPVIGVDIDKQLDLFADASYDVVIMSRTLQAVRYPGVVLRHMMRIAPIAVVSMPNFGYWRNRLRLLGGHAPVSKDLPYQWHDSPNVHFGSSRDLEDLFDQIGLSILKCVALGADGHISRAPIRSRNWSAGAVVYELADQRQPLPSAGRR